MIKNKIKFLVAFSLFCIGGANAQVGIGNTNPNASSALDITSTKGVLISRMNSSERDAIASPANALLIFNTSSNTFEVYKSTCSCWVAINDAGNTPANSLVNTAPTANFLNYTGAFREGGTANIVYTYADAQNDAEGATTIQWEISNDNLGTSKTNLSTGASVTFTAVDAGRFVRVKVTPRAATGILNGIDYYGAWTQIVAGAVPYGSSINVTGTVAQGSLLTGTYTFNGGSGVENSAGSNYNWQSATTSAGLGIANIAIPNGNIAHTTTIRPLITEVGKFIRFGVQAKDDASLTGTNFVYSNWAGPVTLAAEAAPIASNVNFSPTSPGTNVVLTASYTYNDANSDPEGASIYKWYTANNASGAGQNEIAGATSTTFTVTNAEATKYIGFGVTPKALTGSTTGTEVVYYDPSPSVGFASFTIASANQTSNNFYFNRVMDDTDRITVSVNVTSPGSINFTTNTVNGYSFTSSGTYATGLHNIVLTATGTQIAYNAAGDTFTISGISSTTQTTTLTVGNVRLGGSFTEHFNGITGGISSNNLLATYTDGETFNNNGTCISKPISKSSCVGTSITVGSNSYPIANINGQCWMTQNIKELPNGVAINASEWLGTTQPDLGFYGGYHTGSLPGNAGWRTFEANTGEGLLYQWSAAMLDSTLERAQGICPTGWHIPSDCEWMYLEHGVGVEISQQLLLGWRSNTSDNQGTPGYKLRSLGTGATNASGFSAQLVGFRNSNGSFNQRNSVGYWWSSTATGNTNAVYRYMASGVSGVNRTNPNKGFALSIRCLKD